LAEVKWIKIVTDIFDDEKILLIESMPEADAMIVIWFKLLTLAGKINNGGVLLFNDKLPYTDEMLATIFRRPINIVRLAINTFERFGMIEVINNAITIPNWSKHQSLDQLENKKEYMRTYMQEYREKQKLIAEGKEDCKTNSKVNSKANVSSLDIDKELDKELDKDIKKKPQKHKYGEYQNVLLSDEQLEKLQNEFPTDWKARIERVSEYCASTGKSYKDYLATIRNWAKKEPVKTQPIIKPNSFHNFDSKIGKKTEAELEEIARRKHEKFKTGG
jgi:predicted phage replisome organizer